MRDVLMFLNLTLFFLLVIFIFTKIYNPAYRRGRGGGHLNEIKPVLNSQLQGPVTVHHP